MKHILYFRNRLGGDIDDLIYGDDSKTCPSTR